MNNSFIFENLLLETCNNAQLRKYLQHMHLEMEKKPQTLAKSSHMIKAKLCGFVF